jgi:hypothetical protein
LKVAEPIDPSGDFVDARDQRLPVPLVRQELVGDRLIEVCPLEPVLVRRTISETLPPVRRVLEFSKILAFVLKGKRD